MIPNPIHKVLSLIREHGVQQLLMGGQACVLYGAAEFSRDIDLALLLDHENLEHLKSALDVLQAEVIAVPPFDEEHLAAGLAVHFRCGLPEVKDLRIDIMTKMRGVDDFSELWKRRTSIHYKGETIDVLSLPDLVASKKTQRDKDWPMITRLIEANYFANRDKPTREQVSFWLGELRTPSLLVAVAHRFPEETNKQLSHRPLLSLCRTTAPNESAILEALHKEEQAERQADQAYWRPLRTRLEALRGKHPN